MITRSGQTDACAVGPKSTTSHVSVHAVAVPGKRQVPHPFVLPIAHWHAYGVEKLWRMLLLRRVKRAPAQGGDAESVARAAREIQRLVEASTEGT
eukprot:1776509-Rhodomonas_salina.2